MITLARARALEAGIEDVEYRRMDANSHDLEAENFDVAFCRWGLMFVDKLQRTLRDIRATLKPGAGLVIAVWSTADEVPSLSLAVRVMHERLGLPAPDEDAGTAFALADGPALVAALQKAGYEQVRRQPVAVCCGYRSVQQCIDHRLEVSSALRDTLANIDSAEVARAWDAVEDALGTYRAANGCLRISNIAYCLTADRTK